MFKLFLFAERRLNMCEVLFKQMAGESHVLHYLLPEERYSELTSCMLSMNKYPTVRAMTNRYKNVFAISLPVSLANLSYVGFFILCEC